MKKLLILLILLFIQSYTFEQTIYYKQSKIIIKEPSLNEIKKMNTREFTILFNKLILQYKPNYSIDKRSVLIAQMIIEGGQGRCILAKYNNWFGIIGKTGVKLSGKHINNKGDTIKVVSYWQIFKDFKHCLLYKEDTLMCSKRYIKYHNTNIDTLIIDVLYKGGYFGNNCLYKEQIKKQSRLCRKIIEE